MAVKPVIMTVETISHLDNDRCRLLLLHHPVLCRPVEEVGEAGEVEEEGGAPLPEVPEVPEVPEGVAVVQKQVL